jgi:hypothetical protein
MSKLGAFYGSKLGGFRESKLHARGGIATCPAAINLTITGVDAATPCSDIKTGFGLDCSSPFFCVSGGTSAVDGVYYLPRVSIGSGLGCSWRAVFDAPATFYKRNFSGTCIGSATTISTPKIQVSVSTTTAGDVEEVSVTPLDSGGVSSPIPGFVAYFNRVFSAAVPFGTTHAMGACTDIPQMLLSHLGCVILMGGGTFQVDAA